MKKVYDFNKEAKYIGCHFPNVPVLVLRDLDLIKLVLVKNFDHFADHKAFIDEALDPLLGKNLTMLNGDEWRKIRNLLSPSFTSSKMRTMYVLMSDCAKTFTKAFMQKYKDAKAVDMKDVFSRYANSVIATCAFGIEVDNITDSTNEFYLQGKEAANFQGGKLFKILLMRAFPKLTKALNIGIISQKTTDYFVNIIKSTIEERQSRGIRRPDMLQLLMDARETMKLDIIEITAHAFLFLIAGFETSAVQICLMAHELAVHPEIQRKLQEEIDAAMRASNNEPTYEDVNNMAYLDMVFSETLRLHSISMLNRMCSKEFELPPSLPGSKPFLVKPGMELLVPVPGIHMDPDIYQEPEKFDPDRFVDKKAAVSDITALGFGLGSRMCIGNRFAILEAKVALLHLLATCNLVPCAKTCVPLKYSANSPAPMPKGGFWLKIESRHCEA